MVKEVIAVFIGGGLGSLVRFVLSKCLQSQLFPWGTLTSNLLAAFVFGAVTAILLSRSPQDGLLRTLILTGFCGGLSTFSTFNFEILTLLKSGQYSMAATYIFLSLALCLAGLAATSFIFSK